MAKTTKLVILILIIGVIMASLSYCICIHVYKHYINVMLLSCVKAPVRFALEEISSDIENNRNDAAKEKFNILSKCWYDFYSHDGIDSHSFSDILYKFRETENKLLEAETPMPAQNNVSND